VVQAALKVVVQDTYKAELEAQEQQVDMITLAAAVAAVVGTMAVMVAAVVMILEMVPESRQGVEVVQDM
jgi:H+/Cl- antiporter ClcA